MNTFWKRSVAVLIGGIGLFCSSLAEAAAPPPSIAGTWSIVGNQSPGSLVLSQVASGGQCKGITGTIYPGTPGACSVIGYYCPATGRLAFARKGHTGLVNQTWIGNVSVALAGQPLRMGGTFHSVDAGAGGGDIGEYHFQGQK